jgi:hypothetical protein
MFKLPGGVHQVAIYKPGKRPSDFVQGVTPQTDISGCPGPNPGAPDGRYIDDDILLAEVVALPPCGGGSPNVSSSAGIFDEPGRYLVICTFDSHFFNFDMYGWVIVK